MVSPGSHVKFLAPRDTRKEAPTRSRIQSMRLIA